MQSFIKIPHQVFPQRVGQRKVGRRKIIRNGVKTICPQDHFVVGDIIIYKKFKKNLKKILRHIKEYGFQWKMTRSILEVNLVILKFSKWPTFSKWPPKYVEKIGKKIQKKSEKFKNEKF